jgi:23S rRNA (uracil1939-C5)-methyltransferase/tRNA (uracil-5-)-methyltransferase
VDDVVPSPLQFGYRSKLTPHFATPREGGIGQIGFLETGNRYRIVDVPHCDIALPELNVALTELRDEIRAHAERYQRGATQLLRASQGQVLTQSSQLACEVVDGVRFEFNAGDFFQNNPSILPAFVQHVAGQVRQGGARYLVDAYCGSGLFGLSCARYFDELTGVEISESSVAKAQHNAAINDISNARFIAGSAECIFEGITYAPQETAVIVDPPRAGCGESFIEQLCSFAPRTVVYVSCNPATQMRDLGRFLGAGYQLRRVQPFDLFPQTRHLECVLTLEREPAA